MTQKIIYVRISRKANHKTVGGCPPLRMRDSLLKRGEVIAVVTYADLFEFVIMITGLITLCYLVFKNNTKK